MPRQELPIHTAASALPRRIDDAADSLADAILCAPDTSGLHAEGRIREQGGEAFGIVICQLNGVEWTLSIPSALAVTARLIFNSDPTIEGRQRLNFARQQIAAAMKTAASLAIAGQYRSAH